MRFLESKWVFLVVILAALGAALILSGCSHTPPKWESLTDRKLMEQASAWHSAAWVTLNIAIAVDQISDETEGRLNEVEDRYASAFTKAEAALAGAEKTPEAGEAFREAVFDFRLIQAEFVAAFAEAVGEAAD